MKTKDNKLTTDNEQKQAELVMQTSLQLLPLIMNNIPQSVFWKDRNLVYLGCNQAFADDAGFPSPEEIIGKTDFDMPWKDQAELYGADDQRVMELGEAKINYEEPQTTPNGSTIWLSTSKIPVHENGEVIAVLGMYEDITSRKQAEEAVHVSEERFRRFTEVTVEGLVFHEQGRIMDANPAALAMFGIADNGEFIGRSLLEFIVPESHKLVLQQMQLETVLPYEIQCVRKDGSLFPVETSTRTYKVGDQTIRISSIRDIAERKQADQALRDSRQFLQLVMDNIPQAVFWKDQNLAYMGCNQAFAEDAGLESPQDLIGKTDFDMPWTDQAELYRADDQKVMDEGVAKLNYEEPQTNHAGETTWLRTGKVPITDDDGKVFAVLGVYEDITDSKRAEAALQESQRLLQLVMDNIPQAVFWKDKELIYMGANQAFAEDAGLNSPQELVGKSDFDMPWKEQAELYRADDQRVLDLGEAQLNYEEPQTGSTGKTTWLRTSKIPMRDANGNMFGVLGTYEDITERKQAEDDLRKRFEIETLLTTISSRFVTVTPDDLDQKINQSLDMLSTLVGTDRSYLFLIAENGTTMDNTHEWCADGIDAHIGNLRGVPVDTFPWLMERLKKLEVVAIPVVADMPPEAQAEKKEFQAEGIQSIVVVPIIYQSKLAGFMGFDAVSNQRNWETETITVLRAVGETFITTLERIRLQREVQAAFERRGYQVQVSTEISQEVAAALEISDLFERVVTLTKERLDYYHTQLLRYDAAQDAVVLINGYGETGQKMLVDGHKLPMGSGLIGTAAASGQTVLRSTLAEDPDWQPNPLLPDTQGEIAVPIKLGEQVLGVLDVQSNLAGALTEDDRLLLEGLCGQIAVAIEQTRLRQEMAERLEEVNRLYQSMSHEGWKTYRNTTVLPEGFVFDQTGIRQVDEEVLTDELFANIPMRVLGGEVVGMLTVANDPRNPTSSEDYAFFQQVSDQIALALEGARLVAQTQSALAESEKLFDASRSMTQATDLQELVSAAVNTLDIREVNRAVLTTFDYDSAGDIEQLTIIANWWNETGHEVTPIGTRYPLEVIQAMPMFVSPTPVFFNDVLNDERVDATTLELVKRQNLRAVAVLPLHVGSQQIGALVLEAEKPHDFTQDQIRLFTALAPQIATVLENRQQFERAQHQADREAMLNTINQKIQSATSVEAVLQIAARELGHALGAPMTIAQLSVKGQN